MKEIVVKCGTKKEILEYVMSKVKGTFAKIPYELEEGAIFQFQWNTAEKQINDYIQSGSPLVSICLPKQFGLSMGEQSYFLDQFILTDYSEQRLEFEMQRLDNDRQRNEKLEGAMLVVGMDIEAAERNEAIKSSIQIKEKEAL